MSNRVLIAISCFVFLLGCERETKKGDSTLAKLAVVNSTGPGLNLDPQTFTPTVFGLKLIDVRIMQELDSTQHPAPIIWYNPECGTATTSATEVDGKEYEYTQSPGCDVKNITKYFDFARPTAEVNVELNSQPNKIYPEDYKYVSITWCAGEIPNDSIEYQADGMSEPAYAPPGGCGQLSTEAVPPITITEGETVTISLDYSIEGLITDQGSGASCWVSEDGETKRCVSLPQFKPSVTKG